MSYKLIIWFLFSLDSIALAIFIFNLLYAINNILTQQNKFSLL